MATDFNSLRELELINFPGASAVYQLMNELQTAVNDLENETGSPDGGKGAPALLSIASVSAARKNKYDYECDGTADELTFAEAIAALPAAGGVLQLSEGTFTFATELVITKPVVIRGVGPRTKINGAAIVAGGSVERGAIQFAGSRTQAITTVTASVVKGAITLTVASGAGLAAGNYIGIRSGNNSVAGERFHQVTSRPTYYKGEFLQIASVVGTTVTLMGPTVDSYDAVGFTVELDLFSLLDGCGIYDLEIQMSNDATHHCGVRFWYTINPQVVNCRCYDAEYTAFMFYMSRFGTMFRSHAVRSNEGEVGYGFRLVSSLGCNVLACTGEDTRHVTDAGGYGGNTYPDRMHNFFQCVAVNCPSHGHGDHSHAENVNFIACHSYGCQIGLGKRASGIVAFCTVTSGDDGTYSGLTGMSFGEDFDDDQRCGDKLKVVFNILDLTGAYGTTDITGMRITCPTREAYFGFNSIRGMTITAMDFGTWYHRNLRIEHNDIDGTGQEASATGIRIAMAPNAATSGVDGLSIRFNNLRQITGSAIRLTTASSGWTGFPFRDAFIEFNMFDGHANPAIHCADADTDNLFIRFNHTRTGFLLPASPSIYSIDLTQAVGSVITGGNSDSLGAVEPVDMQVQTQSWNPPSLVNTAGSNFTSTSITMTGVKVGETVLASLSQNVVEGMIIQCHVTAADTVRVTLWNFTGATQDLGNGTLRLSRIRS